MTNSLCIGLYTYLETRFHVVQLFLYILVLVIFLVFYFIYIRKRYDNYIIVLTMIGMKVFAAGRPPALLASKDRVYKVPTVRTATGAV
jgi:hypothetical protein